MDEIIVEITLTKRNATSMNASLVRIAHKYVKICLLVTNVAVTKGSLPSMEEEFVETSTNVKYLDPALNTALTLSVHTGALVLKATTHLTMITNAEP